MLFGLAGSCADRVDANRGEVLSVTVSFFVLLAAFLLEDNYFSSAAVLDYGSAHALASQSRSADIDLIAVRRKKSFELD
jgi:predicted transcriptional regulator